jgi:hypothetical protein
MTTYSRVSTHGVRWYAAVTLGVGLFLAAQAAEAVTFSITEAVRTSGSGYPSNHNDDTNETSGTFLDVKFTDSFSSQIFSLDVKDATRSFALGTVKLQEQDAHGGIRAAETDKLDLSWAITFGGPLSITEQMTAEVSADVGEIKDPAGDYRVHWLPVFIDFGAGGQFSISLNDLEFTGRDEMTQTATIKLLKLPNSSTLLAPPPGGSVPEPGTIALFTLGLAGIGAARRKKPAP